MEITLCTIPFGLILLSLPFALLFCPTHREYLHWAFPLLILLLFISWYANNQYIILLAALSSSLFVFNGIVGRFLSKLPAPLRIYTSPRLVITANENFVGNFFLQILNPILFSTTACAYFEYISPPELCKQLWLIVPIYWGMRFSFLSLKNYWLLMNHVHEISAAIIASFFCVEYLLFPAATSYRFLRNNFHFIDRAPRCTLVWNFCIYFCIFL